MAAATQLAVAALLVACAAANEAYGHATALRVSQAPTSGLFRQILLAAERGEDADLDLGAGARTLLARGASHRSGANVTWPKDMHKGPAKDADELQRAEFVRKCTVVTTVTHARLLPTKAVESICRATDQVVKCRMTLSERLKQLHHGGRSMEPFCKEAWEWFLEEYGEKCPQQCRKLQCRSTCLWLEAHKDVKKEEAEINGRLSVVRSSDLDELKAVENNALEAKKAALEQSRAVGFADTYVKRATKAKKEATDAFDSQKKRTDEISVKMKALSKEDEKLTVQIRADSRVLGERQFGMEKLELKTKLLFKNAEAVRSRIPELQREVKDEIEGLQTQEGELSRLERTLDALGRQIAETDETLKSVVPQVEQQQEVAESAELGLKAAIENGEGPDSLTVLEDYLKNQKAMYNDMLGEAKALANQKRKLEQNFVNLQSEVETMAKDIKAKVMRIKHAEGVLATLKAEAVEKEDEAKRSRQLLQAQQDQVAKLQVIAYNKEMQLTKVRKTLSLTRSTYEEEKAKLDVVQQDMDTAAATLALKSSELKKGQELLKHMEAKRDETKKLAEAKRKDFDKKTGGLRQLKEAHKARRRDLYSRMPAIISRHRLDKQ